MREVQKEVPTCQDDPASAAEPADGRGRLDAAVLQPVALVTHDEAELQLLDLEPVPSGVTCVSHVNPRPNTAGHVLKITLRFPTCSRERSSIS